MKSALKIFVAALGLVACSTTPKSTEVAESFQIRKFETQTLKNGLVVLWIPDQALPYVSFQMMVKTGSSQDFRGKEGLAGFTAAMLEKGTKQRGAVRLAEDMEQIGSSFSVSVEPDYTNMSLSSLSFDRDTALELFHEVALSPTFPQGEINRHRKLLLGSLQKLADSPESFADYLMPKFLFGDHPYGHESAGTPKSVRAITQADMKRFYSNYYVPSNSVLAVVGQYDDAFKNKVIADFEGWKSQPLPNMDLPDFPKWNGLQTLLVNRSDLNQAQIQIGFKGVPRNIPEYMELRAALKILGESFGSRLFEEIRVRRGLTYHIRSWFDPRLKSGPMGIYTFTRVDKIGETVEETLKTYRQFIKDGVTNGEVDTVKALMRGQFPRTFETPEALAYQLLILNRYGVPTSYLTGYYDTLNAISKESINATIRKYFDPENLRILVYAPKSKAEEPLRKLGKLEVREYGEFLQ
ncbi:MAG: M16 family metallopeptidase [Bdellovibrionales bacterium]